eukprot:1154611-Pelagomonas_calceolata.AAC.6
MHRALSQIPDRIKVKSRLEQAAHAINLDKLMHRALSQIPDRIKVKSRQLRCTIGKRKKWTPFASSVVDTPWKNFHSLKQAGLHTRDRSCCKGTYTTPKPYQNH